MALLGLDVGSPDHLGPLLGFSGDELSELDRAHRHWHMAYLSHPRLDLGFDEARVDLTTERLDDLGRRTARGKKPTPGPRRVAWHGARYGGAVRKKLKAGHRRPAGRAYLAAPDAPRPRACAGEVSLALPRQQVGNARRIGGMLR